jgi:hypothetical protein
MTNIPIVQALSNGAANGFPDANIYDGDPATCWISYNWLNGGGQSTGTPNIIFSLAQSTLVDSLTLKQGSGDPFQTPILDPVSLVTQVQIQYQVDGSDGGYHDLATFDTPDLTTTLTLDPPLRAKYIRLLPIAENAGDGSRWIIFEVTVTGSIADQHGHVYLSHVQEV